MANENYVVREKYNGLAVIDGQVIPLRGEVQPDELVKTQPDSKQSRRNGGGKRNTDEQGQ